MDLSQRRNGKRVFFSEASFKNISDILSELLSKSRARVVLFAELNGYSVMHYGDLGNIELSNMTALAAANFSATSEIARLIGEPDLFNFIYQEGQNQNAYLCRVSDGYLLAIIFDAGVALGMIRVYANRAVEKLNTLIGSLTTGEADTAEIIDMEFRTLLGQQMDKAFEL